MPITWTEDLATGISDIDAQHRELFARIGALMEACRAGKEADEVGRTMAFLSSYVVTHFDAEERLMQEERFPGFAHHKALHDAFRKDLADLERTLESEGPGLHMVVKTNRVVASWLVEHIGKADRAMGLYMKKRA